MKIRSRVLFLALLAAMVFALGEARASIRVVTSFYPLYVAALNVTEGAGGVEVHNLASPHIGCLHDYQLTAGDARKLSDADLLIVNGAGMESYLGKIRAQYPQLKIIEASEGLRLLDGNPHVWVSPAGARSQVDNIARALAEADPANAARYAANAAAYNGRLAAFETRMKSELSALAGTPVVAQHDSFPYLAKDLGLEVVGVIEEGDGHEPDASGLARTVDLVRAKKVKIIFSEPQYSERLAQTVARETGAVVLRLDPVVQGPADPDRARGAWFEAMERDLSVLRGALR